ncbi:MAG: YfiM family protein [Desulfuromonadales bacterium]|jgi:hypothetical protein|nr:YfiM family protein [Desulfuromonadales bacterium]MDH3868667.1 YfiM family protein [Desulfuromonadales bacterium]MDH4025142.1 YfiM family protein [Desulfuromonadales bacterium]HKJ29595.1 DUF2279 domain-containing protein [Desulfuromonadales bacterium]
MTQIKLSASRIISFSLLFFLVMFLLIASPASALLFDDDLPRETKVRNLNLLAAGATLGWGIINWDYFQKSPQANSEDWFGRETDDGGADKLGHLYTTYALSHLFASIYDSWDYPREEALRLGSFSALGTMTVMELGDSFSDYGFSYEDMIMNCVGAAAGYWLGSHPGWQRRLDLRFEYAPSLSNFESDVITDYEHHKYLLALKADGFEIIADSPLRYLELHIGYYSRGYGDYKSSQPYDDRERIVYVGVGLNVGKAIEGVWRTRIFDYLQLPYTYLPVEHDLN